MRSAAISCPTEIASADEVNLATTEGIVIASEANAERGNLLPH